MKLGPAHKPSQYAPKWQILLLSFSKKESLDSRVDKVNMGKHYKMSIGDETFSLIWFLVEWK